MDLDLENKDHNIWNTNQKYPGQVITKLRLLSQMYPSIWSQIKMMNLNMFDQSLLLI